MKAGKIILVTIGVSLAVMGVLAVKARIEYEGDGSAINSLIANYKAEHIPTNGTEIRALIPNRENAWIEIEPQVLKFNGRGWGVLFKGGIAMELVLGGDSHDFASFDKYLAINQDRREAIMQALDAKPGIQVPHNYNEGFEMLMPEYAAMKNVCKEFCLAAYAAGLRHDIPLMEKNFSYANRFAQYCYSQPELIGAFVGISIQRSMNSTGLRLVEVDPSLLPDVSKYFQSKELEPEFKMYRAMQSDFVAQLVSARYWDSPLADRRKYPFPMDKVFPLPNESEIQKASSPKQGDEVPTSPAMRRFLRKRLEVWESLIPSLKEGGPAPSQDEYLKAYDFIEHLPPALQIYGPMVSTDFTNIYHNLDNVTLVRDSSVALWKSLDLRAKTGHFPQSLDQTGVKIRSVTDSGEILYQPAGNTLVIKTKRDNPDTHKPAMAISFPPTLTMDLTTVSSISDPKAIAQAFRENRIDFNGSPSKSKSHP